MKLAFALNLQKDDLVKCSFYAIDEEESVELERVLIVDIGSAIYDSDEVCISYLCAFNLSPKVANRLISLKLKVSFNFYRELLALIQNKFWF